MTNLFDKITNTSSAKSDLAALKRLEALLHQLIAAGNIENLMQFYKDSTPMVDRLLTKYNIDEKAYLGLQSEDIFRSLKKELKNWIMQN